MVKFRPYLMKFLTEIINNYQIFIYTMGTRSYAESIMMNINN
jgi:TFIIF-interacting CTD phosphatase-like protein